MSDKVCRRLDSSRGDERLLDCSVRNIEHCIAIMLQVVSPMIAKVADQFNLANTPFPLNERVATLTRQLQELIAWSSPHQQAVVAQSFPKYLCGDVSSRSADCGADGSHIIPPVVPVHQSQGTAHCNPTVRVLDDTIRGLVRDLAVKCGPAGAVVDMVHTELYRALNSSSARSHHRFNSISNDSDRESTPREIGISFCGSVALGLGDPESTQHLDFVSHSPPFDRSFYNLPPEMQRAEVRAARVIHAEQRYLESLLEPQLLADSALKHFRACAKDFRTAVSEFLVKLRSTSPRELNTGMSSIHGDQLSIAGCVNGSQNRRGVLSQNGTYNRNRNVCDDNNSTNAHFSGVPVLLSVSELSALAALVRDDADALCAANDVFHEEQVQAREIALSECPEVAAMQRHLETLGEKADRREADRINTIRKLAKAIEKQLKDAGYSFVRVVTHKTRFLHIKFAHQDYGLPEGGVPCSLTVHNVLPLQSTDMLYAYLSIDKSGKVRDFLHIVKLFAKSHRIADPSAGFLSPFAWQVLALHVLLRHGFLPNIHDEVLHRADMDSAVVLENVPTSAVSSQAHCDNAQFCDVAFMTPRLMYLPARFVARLEDSSVFELMDLFFRYYTERFDVFGAVVSLKADGQLLQKTDWPRHNAVLWRLSIEVDLLKFNLRFSAWFHPSLCQDPFDHINSLQPVDLGASLSRPGQLTVKALHCSVLTIQV